MIHSTRLKRLKDGPVRPDKSYVLYWMGLSQRTRWNHALEYAVEQANALRLPLLVCYGLAEKIPETNARHWSFLLEGMAEIGPALAKRGIGFVADRHPPVETALRYADDAALVVCDRYYLKPIQRFYADFAARSPCAVMQVETDVVVPVETASPKHEYAARTFRPKLRRLLPDYLAPLPQANVKRRWSGPPTGGTLDLSDIPKLVASLDCDQGVRPVKRFRGGMAAATERLDRFLAKGLSVYADGRGLPEAGAASHMSPYLHYGQISPLEIALEVLGAPEGSQKDKDTYVEELIIRRELAMNHCHYAPDYDDYRTIPDWAKRTLAARRDDPRPRLYGFEQFEQGMTHDRYWNAAMKEMRETGYMHNHMRMYWGKKILEWSASPEEAFDTALRLNNRYFLDGRDCNSYTNVGWLFGLHDRPWGPRPVYGTVRSLGQATLRKFDADAYVRDVDRLAAAEQD